MAVIFNNCGNFYSAPRQRVSSSANDGENYPWPNNTTTVPSSNIRTSKVVFGDFDRDRFEDAVFFSNSATGEQPILRIVRSGSFEEVSNVMTTVNRPNPQVEPLLFDMDLGLSDQELFYVTEDGSQVIALDLVSTPGQVRMSETLVEPLDNLVEYGFKINREANGMSVEIGHNLIILSSGQAPQVISALNSIDGGWSPWSEWYVFPSGNTCSKACGDGIEMRNRLCNSPEPRNNGAYCPSENIAGNDVLNVDMRTCRIRDCDISECTGSEIFNNGSCDPDPNAPPPYQGVGGTGGVGGGPGSGGGSSGGVPSPDDCGPNEVWDPAFFQCFQAYTYSNITLTHTERVRNDDDSGGGGYTYVDHTYRLSLNHPLAIGFDARSTARQYCVYRGRDDVVTYEVGNYTATNDTSLNGTNVFIYCNPGTNGYFYMGRYSQCPVGNSVLSFGYRGWTHQPGSNVQYLRSVTCRDNDFNF